MRIISETSETDVARQQALDQVEWKIRELTANLCRITRGAGKPYEVMQQMDDLSAAIRSFWDATGISPYEGEFAHALNVSTSLEKMQQWTRQDRDREDAESRIISGVLQIVASRLVGQKTQETIGSSEMYGGINALADLRAEDRKARAKATREARPAVKAKRRRPRS